MATNAIILIVVTAMAALVLARVLVVVVSKTFTSQRHVKGTTIRARRLQQQATVHRSEAAASRDQLYEQKDSADNSVGLTTVQT